jgi:hypothetical protein
MNFMDEDKVGVAPPCGIEGLTCAEREHANRNTRCFGEARQDRR